MAKPVSSGAVRWENSLNWPFKMIPMEGLNSFPLTERPPCDSTVIDVLAAALDSIAVSSFFSKSEILCSY